MMTMINHSRVNDEEQGTYTYSADELQVATILLDLPYLITMHHNHDNDDGFPKWSTKKKRRSLLLSPPSPPPRRRSRTQNYPLKLMLLPQVKSPSSPLNFAPTEPDCILSSSTKRIPKLTSEALRSILHEEMQTKKDLEESIEKVKCHLEELRSENWALKAQKEEYLGRMGENNGVTISSTATTAEVNDGLLLTAPSTSTSTRSQPLVLEAEAEAEAGRRGLFDLNLAPEEEEDERGVGSDGVIEQQGVMGDGVVQAVVPVVCLNNAVVAYKNDVEIKRAKYSRYLRMESNRNKQRQRQQRQQRVSLAT